MSDHVWYAAYGSNLSTDRFRVYLTGGPVPHRPGGGRQHGSRDPALPVDGGTWQFDRELVFAGSSAGWGGGAVAMLGPSGQPEGTGARGRLWRVTTQQFDDVFRQENGLPVPNEGDEWLHPYDRLQPGDEIDVTGRWYGRVVHLGNGADQLPVLTFVGADVSSHQPGPAHSSYLRTMAIGLVETWGLTTAQAASYLAARRGNVGAIDAASLEADLAEWTGP